jgi:hypothetical protein
MIAVGARGWRAVAATRSGQRRSQQGMEPVDPVQERVFRERVADFLFGLSFPATKEQIIRRAHHNNTASQVMDALRDLPDGDYATLEEIQAAVRYHRPHVWDVDGFPPEALRHDELEAERLRENIQRALRPTPPPAPGLPPARR